MNAKQFELHIRELCRIIVEEERSTPINQKHMPLELAHTRLNELTIAQRNAAPRTVLPEGAVVV